MILGGISLYSGCSVVGPNAIRNGRSLYNDAIVATNNQQILSGIVRTRYGEPAGMLAVSSLTANFSMQAGGGFNAGIGPEEYFDGNLVPLEGSFLYEENPTISYTPVDGKNYMKQLRSPLPIESVFLCLSTSQDVGRDLFILVRRLNGIENPDFLHEGSRGVDSRFERVCQILTFLARVNVLSWVAGPEGEEDYAVAFQNYTPEYLGLVRELYALLNISGVEAIDGGDLLLPISLSQGSGPYEGLMMVTRSVYDLVEIAAGNTMVPIDHLQSGMARSYPPPGPVGKGIRIYCANKPPKNSMVAVGHHGRCFYIDATDQESKRFFGILQTFLSVQIAEVAKGSASPPVLTVPVSK